MGMLTIQAIKDELKVRRAVMNRECKASHIHMPPSGVHYETIFQTTIMTTIYSKWVSQCEETFIDVISQQSAYIFLAHFGNLSGD